MLQIQHLSKRFGKFQSLTDLSLQIQPGAVYGLLGPNGAGKTTTINIICGLLKADSGSVFIADRLAGEPTKPLVGVVPQENLLYNHLTCAEHLRFFGQIYGLSSRQRRRRIQSCLQAVNLWGQANTVAEKLSGGMRRRLSLAIALVHRPRLLILDEPTTGLDIESRYEVWRLISELKQSGITVLLTTHLLDEVEKLCDRIGILKQGQLLAEGTLAELQQRVPAQEVVTVVTDDPEGAIARGRAQGFIPQNYGGDLAFWIPEQLDLKDLLDRFQGVPLNSISRSPVRLEHIYLSITRPS